MATLNKTIYDRLDLAGLLASVEPVFFRFASVLDAKAKELEGAGDPDGAAVLSLLFEVCTYGLKPDDAREPYGPRRGRDLRASTSVTTGLAGDDIHRDHRGPGDHA